MPELPEVETIRRGLNDHLPHKKISEVIVRLPKIVRGDVDEFVQTLSQTAFTNIARRGKLLILWLAPLSKNSHQSDEQNSTQAVLIHLKMTGQLIYRFPSDQTEVYSIDKSLEPNNISHQYKRNIKISKQIAGGHPWPDFSGQLPNQYSHVIFSFDDGSQLFFNDLRQFGYLQLVDSKTVRQVVSTYGLEPGLPEFTQEEFLSRLANRRGKLKAVLLNQQIFSGLGNIYVDESCFWAGVLPTRTVESLTLNERIQLHQAIVKVITHAIEQRGTTVHDFVDANGKRGNYSDFLMVYGREGQVCLRCGEKTGAVIEKIKFAGRGTHFCPVCQV